MRIFVLSLVACVNLMVAVAPAFAKESCEARCYRLHGFTQKGHQCASNC